MLGGTGPPPYRGRPLSCLWTFLLLRPPQHWLPSWAMAIGAEEDGKSDQKERVPTPKRCGKFNFFWPLPLFPIYLIRRYKSLWENGIKWSWLWWQEFWNPCTIFSWYVFSTNFLNIAYIYDFKVVFPQINLSFNFTFPWSFWSALVKTRSLLMSHP